MGRVLRIGAGVMGVLLVVMTAGLWVRRATTKPAYGTVFVQISDYTQGNGVSLQLVVPELDYTRRITPLYYSLAAFTPSADSSSRLFYASEPYTGRAHLYRFDLNKWKRISNIELGVGTATNIGLSPDKQWINFGVYTGNHLYDCRLKNVQTGQTISLQMLFVAWLNTVDCGQFSADSQWFWFYVPEGYDPMGWQNIYRIRLSDGFLDRIYERLDGATIEAGSLDGHWIIGRPNNYGMPSNQLFRTDPHQIDWQPILHLSHTGALAETYNEQVEEWLPEQGLVIVRVIYTRNYQQIMAIPLAGGPPRWVLNQLTYLPNLDHPKWLFFMDVHSNLYRMRPDGTGFTLIARLPTGYKFRWMQLITDSSGTDWLYIDVAPPQNGTTAIWRMHLDGTHFEHVLNHVDEASIEGGSPDHHWLLLKLRLPNSWGSDYYQVGLDGSHQKLVLTEYTNSHRFFSWFLNPTQLSYPILLLMVGLSLIEIGILGPRPYQIIRQRLH